MSVLDELYREILLNHYQSPRNFGVLPGASRRAGGMNPSCGDQVEVMVRLEGEVIADIRFQGQGCAISTASASLMTEAVKGKKVEEALELSRKFQAMVVEGGPPDPALGDLLALQGVARLPARVKCATLAWHALEEALR
ncbi:Fe-S cluster assembly sulfur transfer protein SufU [Thermus islandicus]|uniref:Fe-S cluster assembly sulfur transfer protein SufU n=1 Tax=Thermus islandicus TaxID=540988 RepID=UPI0003B5738E|nr:SUF system NifU family Fe-S cluster assembly protein [Thermus islandicus]